MSASTALWQGVNDIIARAPSVAALHWHRVDLLAARRQRALALPIPGELHDAERAAAMMAMAVPVVLRRARAAWDGPLVLMKGPEAAASYQDPEARPFRDLDLLAVDAEAAQRAMLAAGFIELAGQLFQPTPYHLRPLVWPGLPLMIELHEAPHYVPGLRVPSTACLLSLTKSSCTAVDGVQAFLPPVHAVLLAVHGWAHGPLGRLGHLIDVAAALGDGDRRAADELACSWGCQHLWRTTMDAVDSLLLCGREPLPLRTWGRHLRTVRERTLLESHVADLAAPAWALLPTRRIPGIGAALWRTARRVLVGRWIHRLHRSRRVVADALTPRSEQQTLSATEGKT